jgi:Carboxypeptidase regulatory-like domain
VVRASDGQPIAGARVFFASGPGRFPDVAALTDNEGRFTLSAPTPGIYQIEAAADGFAASRNAVDVRRRRQVDMEISLRRV